MFHLFVFVLSVRAGLNNGAFSGCTNLESITIPNSVTSIGDGAFGSCYKSNYHIKLNQDDNAYYLGNDTNPYLVLVRVKNADISTFDIKSQTRIIYSEAFQLCKNLTNITIPDGVTSICNRAFANCTNLESITIPSSVTSISKLALAVCSSLSTINYNGTTAEWQSVSKGANWDYYTPDYTVYCTDGKVSKDGTVTPD